LLSFAGRYFVPSEPCSPRDSHDDRNIGERQLKIELQGNLAAMLKAAQAQSNGASLAPLGRWGDEKSPDDDDLVQIMLVAGARNQLYLEFTWTAA